MKVRCTHCNARYDLGGVETIARYADCTVYKAPCCGRMVDDRRWKSLPDIERVEARDELFKDIKRAAYDAKVRHLSDPSGSRGRAEGA